MCPVTYAALNENVPQKRLLVVIFPKMAFRYWISLEIGLVLVVKNETKKSNSFCLGVFCLSSMLHIEIKYEHTDTSGMFLPSYDS